MHNKQLPKHPVKQHADETTMDLTTQADVSSDRINDPIYNSAIMACVGIGLVASVIRVRYGWTYEEAGILLNLAFWGGYGMVCFYLGPIILIALARDWSYASAIKKLKLVDADPMVFSTESRVVRVLWQRLVDSARAGLLHRTTSSRLSLRH